MSYSSLRHIGFCLIAFALAVTLTVVVRWRRADPRCPGPRLRSWLWFAPLSWVRFGGCRYMLRGLAPDEQGGVRCPECGRVVPPARTLHRRHRRNTCIVMTAIALFGYTLTFSPRARGKWPKLVPTFALVLTDRVTEMPPEVIWRELDRRMYRRGAIDDWSAESLVKAAVADLRNDNSRGNATRAIAILKRYRTLAVPYLDEALLSSDYQQRQAAAHLLRKTDGYAPTDDLLRVTYEGLADDTIPNWHTPTEIGIFNAREGQRYFLEHPELAMGWLNRGLRSTDPQQQVICASIAARSGIPEMTEAGIAHLIESLRDNDIPMDADVARRTLREVGRRAVPALEAALDSDDEQQRRFASYVLDHIEKDEARGDQGAVIHYR